MLSISRTTPYRLDGQIGFILRRASQCYAMLFANGIGNGLAPIQWAALIRLSETGLCPQNQLDRLTVMDAATTEGVVECLDRRGLIQHNTDPDDGRHLLVSLNPAGRTELEAGLAATREINWQALVPLSPQEQEILRGLLTRLT